MQIIRNPKHGDTISAVDTMYPSDLEVVTAAYRKDKRAMTYGYVLAGTVGVSMGWFSGMLNAGSFFAVPTDLALHPDSGAVVVLINRYGYRGQAMIGSLEAKGRLTYIDGCSDTMLVYPPRLGDPVLNHLHFPKGIKQTQHTHPSIRLGIIARGKGYAFGPGWKESLDTGCVFLLDEHEMHSFETVTFGETMDVIAYHPDSDFGPTDQNHPMLNRTYIGADAFKHTST